MENNKKQTKSTKLYPTWASDKDIADMFAQYLGSVFQINTMPNINHDSSPTPNLDISIHLHHCHKINSVT